MSHFLLNMRACVYTLNSSWQCLYSFRVFLCCLFILSCGFLFSFCITAFSFSFYDSWAPHTSAHLFSDDVTSLNDVTDKHRQNVVAFPQSFDTFVALYVTNFTHLHLNYSWDFAPDSTTKNNRHWVSLV